MKKVYNYYTGRLINESADNRKSKLKLREESRDREEVLYSSSRRRRRAEELEECGEMEECDEFDTRKKRRVEECGDNCVGKRKLVKPAKRVEESTDNTVSNVDFHDVCIVNAVSDIHTENQLKRVILRNTGKRIAIWEFLGNGCFESICDILDEISDSVCSFSAKDPRLQRDVIEGLNQIYHGEEFFVVDHFTYGDVKRVYTLLRAIDQIDLSNVTVICVGRIDSPANEYLGAELADTFENYLYTPARDEYAETETNESVAMKFAKYRKLYESEEGTDDVESADETPVSKEQGETSKEEPETTDAETSQEEETEDVPMTAIVLTVKKEDVDRCKEELIDAGIPEDAISEVEEDEESENGRVKVDADYAIELKDYLKSKGIDLEEKIGGEIIDDAEEKKEKENVEADDEESIDFDKEFGDIFGDDDESLN